MCLHYANNMDKSEKFGSPGVSLTQLQTCRISHCGFFRVTSQTGSVLLYFCVTDPLIHWSFNNDPTSFSIVCGHSGPYSSNLFNTWPLSLTLRISTQSGPILLYVLFLPQILSLFLSSTNLSL